MIGHRPAETKRDLTQAIRYLHMKFPGVPIDVGSFSSAAIPILDVMEKIDDVRKVIILNGGFLAGRMREWHNLKTPVLLIQTPSSKCPNSPIYEAQLVAEKNRFVLVTAGYKEQENKPSCSLFSQFSLFGLDQELVDLVTRWCEGREIPMIIGYPNSQVAWREQVIQYMAPGAIGMNRLEMTLLLPDGHGPFPILIFNHGDAVFSDSAIKDNARVRLMLIAFEYLKYGIAVAFPSRPGIGLSEGTYALVPNVTDGDPLYIARIHTKSILPAIDYLKTRPDIDTHKIIIGGQSAGGYAAMYIASLNLDGIIGAIDFSGGRTDHLAHNRPNYLNTTMVNGFEELGKTTHIPSLWIYAENDSRFTVNTIRSSYEKFVHAGGKATLLLTPPIPGDGHYAYEKPELWRSALTQFLKELGITEPIAKNN